MYNDDCTGHRANMEVLQWWNEKLTVESLGGNTQGSPEARRGPGFTQHDCTWGTGFCKESTCSLGFTNSVSTILYPKSVSQMNDSVNETNKNYTCKLLFYKHI